MYAKKGITSATGFTFATWQIIYSARNIGLSNSSEFLSFFIEVSEEIWRKIKYLLMHLVVLAFIGVRSYKHTIYCATKLAFPYVFFFVFRIARSRTVWVTVIFKAWFLNVSHLVFFIACEIYFLLVLSKRFIRSKERASRTWLRHQSGNKHRPENGCVWKKLLKCWYTENVT